MHCFNFKELNLNNHIERLRKELTDLAKCPKCVLFTLQDQIITMIKAPRIARFVENMGKNPPETVQNNKKYIVLF